MEIINHGKSIIRDYRKNKFWGKVKNVLGVAFWKSLFVTEVSVFVIAGFFSANALVGFHL